VDNAEVQAFTFEAPSAAKNRAWFLKESHSFCAQKRSMALTAAIQVET
jgi:hypothetical protein